MKKASIDFTKSSMKLPRGKEAGFFCGCGNTPNAPNNPKHALAVWLSIVVFQLWDNLLERLVSGPLSKFRYIIEGHIFYSNQNEFFALFPWKDFTWKAIELHRRSDGFADNDTSSSHCIKILDFQLNFKSFLSSSLFVAFFLVKKINGLLFCSKYCAS